MKILKIIMIAVVIIIIIAIIGIVLLWRDNKMEQQNIIQEDGDQDISDLVDEKFNKVSEYNLYYSIKNCIDQYVLYFKQINGDENLTNSKEETTGEEVRKEGISTVWDTLDSDYIRECSITKAQVSTWAEKYKQNGNYDQNVDYDIDIESMYFANANTETGITIVLVKSKINQRDFNIILKIDEYNSTYTVLGEEYINKYQINENTGISQLKITQESIKQNDYNRFEFLDVSINNVIIDYFNNFKNRILKNDEQAYNLLDTEYRDKRFGNINAFQKYMEENRERFSNAQASKYTTQTREGGNTDYIYLDQNGYYYIIIEKGVMDYTVILDTYTIDLPEFIEKYKKGNGQIKVGMNIEKVISAINCKDYDYVYNKLDETFRNNNFGNVENLKQYLEANLFDTNKAEYTSYAEKGNNIYVYGIKVSSTDGDIQNTKNMNIIMQIKEGTDFVMSFEMN